MTVWAVAGPTYLGLSAVSPALLVLLALLLMIGGILFGGNSMNFGDKQFGDYATDKALEIQGVRVELGGDSDVWFRIKRSGGANKDYDREVARLSKPLQKELRRGNLDNETAEQKIILPAYINTCMITWGGIKDDDGNEIPFSRQACRELFDEFPDIFAMLRDYSSELSTFRRAEMGETADRLGES